MAKCTFPCRRGPLYRGKWLLQDSANFSNLATTTSSQMSGVQQSNTLSYHSRHDISAVGSGRWMAGGGVLCSCTVLEHSSSPFLSYTPRRSIFHSVFHLGSCPRSSAESLQQSLDWGCKTPLNWASCKTFRVKEPTDWAICPARAPPSLPFL